MIEVAHRIDSGEQIESDTESKNAECDVVTQSKTRGNEIITQSNRESQELKSDFVTNSIISYDQAIEVAKEILKSKKSARISVAKIISEIYQETLPPEDFKS
ncbi:Oligopeptide transport system permease protein OppC (plasmid) [Nostoc flagelliforme CCNUN1]|uniref:Oligopeptide transport system permease protein OppC n=1 Tax=Nostoc flagelliforme CCNUN1 TaxID=2038116 RepID=A0A2K8T7W6_9NOSO|nr:Oligopeptide transport system permease protein OppC [Nostoc flagelliforme CCNUN1]AUB35607.1 Oligopeptide transport system permease protein OppC [Nostoc flagelliforme CCNUN1]AUB38532.1 Oligopeptide transport system permease protein OppC [Nostoc flagelliforme CCNUN1]AUB41505.1 Oligopeptide transport system permease protein OppC [Nostoc flagelliforme CCNUN1]AUB41747.1 Oligopeptide transport system permease protein OppC [Nostoc flagelliforme CCNUN1]